MYEISQLKGISPETLVYLASEHRKNRRPPTLRAVFDDMIWVFNAKEKDIINARRYTEHVQIRQLFSYAAKHLTKATLEQIGIFLGGRDHTTILYSIRKVEGFIEVHDESFIGLFNYYRHTSKIWRDKP